MDALTDDLKMQGYLNSLLLISLNHNAAVTEYCTRILAGGPMKSKEQYRNAFKELERIHDEANANHIKVSEQMAKVLGI